MKGNFRGGNTYNNCHEMSETKWNKQTHFVSLWKSYLPPRPTITAGMEVKKCKKAFSKYLFIYLFIFRAAPWLMEVLRLGVELELQLLLAYITATATPDLSHVCDLHHNSWQHWIPNPLSEARGQTHILMDTSQFLNLLRHTRNSSKYLLSTLAIVHLLHAWYS